MSIQWRHESEKTYYHFCADTIVTTKEIEGNVVGPNIKRMNLNIA